LRQPQSTLVTTASAAKVGPVERSLDESRHAAVRADGDGSVIAGGGERLASTVADRDATVEGRQRHLASGRRRDLDVLAGQ